MSVLAIVRRPQPLATALRGDRAPTAFVAVIPVLAASIPWALAEAWWVEFGVTAVLLIAAGAALVDSSTHRIPDRIVLWSLVPTAIVIAAPAIGGDGPTAVPGVVFGAIGFALPLLAVHLAAPSALGFGDAKLAVSLGAALGLVDWRMSVAALCLASGLTAAVALVRRRSSLPFAPGLVVGAALVLLMPTLEGSLPWR